MASEPAPSVPPPSSSAADDAPSSSSSKNFRLVCSLGSETADLSQQELQSEIDRFLESLGPRDDVLLIPPDFTRFHSQAGLVTQLICEHYGFIQQTTPTTTKSCSTSTKQESPQTNKKPKLQAETAETKSETASRCTTKIQILPALGTHAPMTDSEIRKMYGDELADKHMSRRRKSSKQQEDEEEEPVFLVHDWRNDVVTIGHVPAPMVCEATRGMLVDRPWPAQLNRLVWDKRLVGTAGTTEQQQEEEEPSSSSNNSPVPPRRSRPLVLSIGQVVPHEVMGMANFNKNLFVGTGGVEAINLSHYIGAVIGMERMMGRKDNPLRDILNYASEHFLEKELDLWYLLTVVSPPDIEEKSGSNKLCIRGLFIGNDIRCYSAACDLSLKVNFTMLDRPVSRMVTYLDPEEFHSTWLGNKAIYRTRMAMADHGRLYILAPGVSRFGEDRRVDELIRKYGYRGTPAIMTAMQQHPELQDNLSAVAHLIHGSSEGRFQVTYCPGQHLSREEIEAVGFQYGDLKAMSTRYDIEKLQDGWHTDEEGEFYFIRNPALGLWAVQSRFDDTDTTTTTTTSEK